MSDLYLLHKPYRVLSQFSDREGRATLAELIDIPGIYPAGRLDYDSEGLLLLSADGSLIHRIAHPRHKQPKTYWVQVEGRCEEAALQALRSGITLKDGPTRPAKVRVIAPPRLADRNPPVEPRRHPVTSWLELTITEGRNRQVRRMTAHVGLPTLRLIRVAIGPWRLEGLAPGEWRREVLHAPQSSRPNQPSLPNKSSRPTKGKRRP
ncbi:pseudouridine synthase [Halomonas sp. Bachu 37]|uniref:pseudouridine synthase n=1 Tax=Halomonas kashgarensis TaxID=3084920 RepID=UPI0032170F0C